MAFGARLSMVSGEPQALIEYQDRTTPSSWTLSADTALCIGNEFLPPTGTADREGD